MIEFADLRARLRAARDLPPPAERRAIRVGAKVSQQFMADVIGCSRPAVTAYEKGTRNPSGTRLKRYAEALRILQEEGTPTSQPGEVA